MTGTIALVSGANRGIGRATARALAERGMTVLLGSRSAEQGASAAEALRADGFDVVPVRLDVTDDRSVEEVAHLVEERFGRLDVLVNNAGRLIRRPATEITAVDMHEEFDTNVFGLVRMIHTLLPLLRRSHAPRIVNVSSDSSSFARTTEPGSMFERSHESFVYSATKAAVNMLTLKYANAFRDDPALAHIKINAVTPGYTATDLNNFAGSRTVEEGARASVAMAVLGPDGHSGGFFDENGPVAW